MTLWSPTDLGSATKYWFAADALSGSNGSSVATLPDSSGSGNNTTSGGTSATLVVPGLNSLNTIHFNGSSDWYTLPSGFLSGWTSGMALYVQKLTTYPPPSHDPTGPTLGDFGTEAQNNHSSWTDGNIYDDFLSSLRPAVTPSVSLSSYRIIAQSSVSSTWGFWIDGTSQTPSGSASFAVNTATGASGPKIGASKITGSDVFLDGDIAEIVILNGTTSTTDRQLTEGYLAWKWGLQGNLPAGHPYKSAAPTVAGPSVGSASGTSTASGVGQALFTGVGSASGTSTASGVGQALFTGVGSAAGTSTALGVSVAVAPAPAFQSDAFQTNAFQAQYVISLSLSANVTLSDSLYSQRTVNLDLTDDVTLSDTVSSVIRPRKIGMVWAYQWIVLTVDRADN